MDDGGTARSLHLSARSYQNKIMQEMSEKNLTMKDQRRRELARGLMTKYTRELLTKHSVSAQNFYFQHSKLSSMMSRKHPTGGEFDGSKGLDLNSVYHLSMGIEDETHSIGAFGSFINILRHLLLIPSDAGLAGRIWSLVEMFVHQLVMSKDDGRKDIAKIGVEEFKQAFEAKDKPNIQNRHKAMDCIFETMSILFPKLDAGNFDSDPNFQSTPKQETPNQGTSLVKKATPKPSTPAVAAATSEIEVKPPKAESTEKLKSKEPPPAPAPPPQEAKKPMVPPPVIVEASKAGPSTGIPPPPPPPPPPPLAKGAATALKPTMKRFNWVKLTPQQIHGTIFQEENIHTRLKVNIGDLEHKFALKPATSTLASSNSSHGKPRGTAVLHLLDPKKAQNLGILLTSIRAPYSEIRRAIVTQDSDVLSVGNAISLIKMLPTDDEKTVLASNKDGILGKPEKFLLEIMDVPLLRERLEGYVLRKEFEFRVEDATKILEDCSTCLADVRDSASLKSLLRFVLDIGNAMNKGYVDRNGGGAQGFKLSSILKLQDTKTSDNKSNLLFHIVEHIEEHAPAVLEMAYKEMPVLKRGTKEYLHSAQMEAREMNDQLQALEHAVQTFVPLDSSDEFFTSMTTFANTAGERLKALSLQVEAVKQQYNAVAKFFGEDGEQEDFVSTLITFCGLLEKTQDDVVFARSEAEKSGKKAKNKLQTAKEEEKGEGKEEEGRPEFYAPIDYSQQAPEKVEKNASDDRKVVTGSEMTLGEGGNEITKVDEQEEAEKKEARKGGEGQEHAKKEESAQINDEREEVGKDNGTSTTKALIHSSSVEQTEKQSQIHQEPAVKKKEKDNKENNKENLSNAQDDKAINSTELQQNTTNKSSQMVRKFSASFARPSSPMASAPPSSSPPRLSTRVLKPSPSLHRLSSFYHFSPTSATPPATLSRTVSGLPRLKERDKEKEKKEDKKVEKEKEKKEEKKHEKKEKKDKASNPMAMLRSKFSKNKEN